MNKNLLEMITLSNIIVMSSEQTQNFCLKVNEYANEYTLIYDVKGKDKRW